MKKPLSIFLYLTLVVSTVFAEDIEFRASAPAQVISGKPFQITYTVNKDGRDLRIPEFEVFDILAGPYTSTSSSTQWLNGKRTSSYTKTFTYTLSATKEGTFSIRPATIQIDKETYTSNGLKITVLPPDQTPANTNNAADNSQSQSSVGASTDNDRTGDIFIRTIVSKTNVHEQECILLSYKLYFAGVDVAQFTNNTTIPDFKGFLKQEIDLGDIQTELEHYNNRNYQTAVLYQTLLYPQHSGTIKIEPASFEAVLRVRNRVQTHSIFSSFFDTYSNVTRKLKSPGVSINVDALPKGKPKSFSGGVGQYQITSSLSTDQLHTNEAVTLRLEIKGNGNLKLLKTPTVEWPEGFEVYDPKVTNNFKTTVNGTSGTKTIEYLAISRASGDFTIPAIEFSYFDTQSDTYNVLSTPEYTLYVQRSADDANTAVVVGNHTEKENIKQLNSDIRYIYTGELPVAKRTMLHFGDLVFWLCYLIPLLLATILFIIFHRQIRENADLVKVRYKKANKTAQRRLRKAKGLMTEGNKEQFYEEIERAAWTYLSDRLSIPTADLNKENISQILSRKGVADDIIKQVLALLSNAEFARYAPAATGYKMQDIYQETIQLIDQLETCKL